MNATFTLPPRGRGALILERYSQFMLGAVVTASLFYGALALAGSLVVATSASVGRVVMVVGLAASLAWHALQKQHELAWPRRQIRRDVALHRRYGMLVYGGLLGVAVRTLVTTPLVWVGVAGAFTSGTFALGVAYGAAFGVARAAALIVHFLLIDGDTERADRVLDRHTRLVQPFAVAGACMLSLSFFLTWR